MLARVHTKTIAKKITKTVTIGSSVSFLLVLLITAFTTTGTTPTVTAADTNCQVFPETGFSVCGTFLDYWNSHGGLAQQGYPISQVFPETNAAPPAGDGKVHKVQYFQRARFEEHLENQPPYNVLLGLLGTEQYMAKYGTSGAPAPVNLDGTNCQTFKETGFQACGTFLDYWNNHGGLTQQGYPISTVFLEQNAPPPAGDGQIHKVQYFQRARFEEHTENQPPYNVLLGLLGAEQYGVKYGKTGITPTTPGNGTPVSTVGAGTPTPTTVSGTTVPPSTGDTSPTTPSAGGQSPTPVHGSTDPTAGQNPTPTPGASAPANGCLAAYSGGGQYVQACVSQTTPAPDPNGSNTVYVRLLLNNQPAPGAQVSTIWHYRTKDVSCSATAGGDGVASCSQSLDGAESSYRVAIDIAVTYNGQNYTGAAEFIPH